MMAILDERGDILCAAGCDPDDGFFRALPGFADRSGARAPSRGSRQTRPCVRDIDLRQRSPHSVLRVSSAVIEYGEDAGFEWGFFTLTNRLSLLLKRIGPSYSAGFGN